MTSKEAIARSDEALLAQLGYKQEFKRAFTPLEVRIRPLRFHRRQSTIETHGSCRCL